MFLIRMLVLLLAGMAAVQAETAPADPLASPQWSTLYALYFKDQPVVFDTAVEVIAPPEAEDSMHVPVAVRFPALAAVEEVLVFADLNPIPKVLRLYPKQQGALLAFSIRVQQSTPIRAAARTADGVWHVNGMWVAAAGGGCTLPSATRAVFDLDRVGEVQGRVWTAADGGQRVKFQVTHPMDTGLIAGIPAYYLETVTLSDAAGVELARLETFEPLSENPLFSLEIAGPALAPYTLAGRDNNGLSFEAVLP